MRIGPIQFDNPIVLAPLAGITNLAFRLLAKEAGCALTCSEMISANGLVRGSHKTCQMLESCAEEKPFAVQIFGADPAVMADAAAMVEATGADIVDINFGCSVKKVVKTGAGVALMRTPERAEALLQAVRRAVRVPLTIKIRSGWDASGDQALVTARLAEFCGVDAITIHPRTASQGFRGKADWSLIARIRRQVGMTVIGNGDVESAPDAVRMLDETGCDGVMIGRAAIGYPWIFSETLSLLGGHKVAVATVEQRIDAMRRYFENTAAYVGEGHACRMMRSRLGWFAKGLPHAAKFRESIKRIATGAQCRRIIDAYRDILLAQKDGEPTAFTPPSPNSPV
jgi:nifR3 family TIM-barrel protein